MDLVTYKKLKVCILKGFIPLVHLQKKSGNNSNKYMVINEPLKILRFGEFRSAKNS